MNNIILKYILKIDKKISLLYYFPFTILFAYITIQYYPMYLYQSSFKKGMVKIEVQKVDADVSFLSGTRGAQSLLIKSTTGENTAQNCYTSYIRDTCDAIRSYSLELRKKQNFKSIKMNVTWLKITSLIDQKNIQYSILSASTHDNALNIQTNQQAAYQWFYWDKTYVFMFFLLLSITILLSILIGIKLLFLCFFYFYK
ncbi:hypothetical protein ACKLNO_09405 [Neisseriaceae bacterium B1]